MEKIFVNVFFKTLPIFWKCKSYPYPGNVRVILTFGTERVVKRVTPCILEYSNSYTNLRTVRVFLVQDIMSPPGKATVILVFVYLN